MSTDYSTKAEVGDAAAATAPAGTAPGKTTRTAGLGGAAPVASEGGGAPIAAGGGAGAGAAGGGDDPFGMHLIGNTGAALPAANRGAAEGSLGVDLSAVRVHTGPAAAASAASLSAEAYTIGSDIYFGAGMYAPGSPGGDHLIAHELVHVAQQGGAPAAPQLRGIVTDVAEPAELEAERGADAIVAGQPFAVHARPSGIARRTNPAESISGNPGERGTVGGGTATTTHRTPTIGDAANAPTAAAPAPIDARAANVKVNAPRERPLHFDGPVSPLPNLIFEEGEQVSPPPSGFTAVTEIRGTTEAPIVEQVADPGIYIANQPTADDVQQGGIGDCYFQAVLMGMAARDPARIKSMMVADGSGGATVTLWRRNAHTRSWWERITGGGDAFDYTPVQVAVSADLAVNISNGRIHGSQLRCAPQPGSVDYWGHLNGSALEVHRKDVYQCARWAPLMEKAYARFTQEHGQYGGAVPHQPGSAAGTPGYDGINSGVANHALHVLYGEAADAAGALTFSGNLTAFPTAGSNILAANPGAVDQLLLLAGRQDAAQPGDATAPILTANTNPDAQITNLATAITNAMADADWAALGADTHTKIATLQTAITTYQGTPPDPAGTPGPKAAARSAVGNAAVEVARTPNHEHLAELRRHNPSPITFDVGSDAVKPTDAPRLTFFGRWLEYVSVASLCPFVVDIVGHASSDGGDAENQTLSEGRATNTRTALHAGRDATKMARHTYNVSGVGEAGAAATPAWRRADITIEHGAPDNELFAGARSPAMRAMMDLVLNVRNLGTDNSVGQRNVYAGHAYNVVGINFVTTTNVPVPLHQLPPALRATMYPVVDCEVSTVRLRNPHHGNEPDRTGMNQPTRPGDGAPSGPTADGTFTMSVNEFFRNFNTLDSGVFPTTR